MPKSFNEIHVEIADITGEDSSAYLTRFKRWINDTFDLVSVKSSQKILETFSDITTATSTSIYDLPQNFGKLLSATIINSGGDVVASPQVVEDSIFWDKLQRLNTGTSDFTQYVYQIGQDLHVYPTFGSSGDTIRLRHREVAIHMTEDDYTTGTISAATNANATVTGASTLWTSQNPVRNHWIKFTVGSGEGDNRWYKVSAFASDTSITLESPYLGTTFTGASLSYILAQIPQLAASYHNLLVYRPLALYYDHIENISQAERYWRRYDGGNEAGLSKEVGGMLRDLIDTESGMSEGTYYPPQGSQRLANAEEQALFNITGESWL